MMRNGNIRDFFGKPKQPITSSQSPVDPPREQHGGPPDIPSSPTTPPKPAVKKLSRDDEIRGSDEEADSDGSIESLSALFGGTKNRPAPYQRASGVTTTPKAKRVASGGTLHASPLTLQQKQESRRHKFDLKALLRDSAQDERTTASAKRADDLLNEVDEDDRQDNDGFNIDRDGSVSSNRLGNLKTQALGLMENDDEGKGDKLARAIDRTNARSSRKHCLFFSPDHAPPALVQQKRNPFPYDKATGRWKFLADPNTRDQAVIHGLAHTVLSKGRELPGDLLVWILNQVCVEQNLQLQLKFCSLIVQCRKGTLRLVNEARLYFMLEAIGGLPSEFRHQAKFEITTECEDSYYNRDWSGLVALLRLLKDIAPNLRENCVACALQLLLKMSLDPVVKTVVYEEHSAALEALVCAIPDTEDSWNDICEQLSVYLLAGLDDVCLLIIPISAIRPANARLSDLRRRLAASVLFRASSWATSPLDTVLTLDHLMARLDDADFEISPQTDYEALKALITLLDTVINDAQFIRTQSKPRISSPQSHDVSASPSPVSLSRSRIAAATITPSSPTPKGNFGKSSLKNKKHTAQTLTCTSPTSQTVGSSVPISDAEFDAQVDQLAKRLGGLHDRVHDNNSPARKEARTAADALAKRLLHSVRSRPPPKTSIFDDPDVRQRLGLPPTAAEEKEMKNQKNFMRNWAAPEKKPATKDTEEDG